MGICTGQTSFKFRHKHKCFNVISRFMRVRKPIFAILFISLYVSCNQKTNNESEKVEVTKVALHDYHVEDNIEPPPPDLISRFKNLNDWLVNVSNEKPLNKSISKYEFGLFESPGDYTIFLVGINEYMKGDTSYTLFEFKPANMYFKLPESEYKNMSRDKLLNRLVSQLKDFTETKKFETSFFTEADKITFTTNGQEIWSKPQ